MLGLTVVEVAKELGITPRTVFRMLKDGRLTGEKVPMPCGKENYIWIIDPLSVVRLQVKKEMKGGKD